jgi:PAS domain S-box-containing protein
MSQSSPFLGKVLERIDKLDAEGLRLYIKKIAEEKGYLETIFNTLQEGVVTINRFGYIEYYNRAACRLLQLPEHDAEGKQINRYLKDLDWGTLLQSEKAIQRDLEVHYPEHRWLKFHLLPLAQGDEESMNYVVIVSDITQEQSDKFKAIDSERVNAITLLAAGVAHEVGNPLNSVNIHLQLMERDAKKIEDPRAKNLVESIEIAREEISRLDGIIHRFLKAIRPGKPDLKPSFCDQLLDDVLKSFKAEIENRDIIVEKEVLKPCPELNIDAEQIKQAFYNIVRNGIQAMAKDGILRVVFDHDNEWQSISFIDNGDGIDIQDIPHVMEPYYTTKTKGSGLGLMIVHRIVHEHGGQMEIESQKNSGTTVRLKLPLKHRRFHLLEEGGAE